MRRRVTLLDYPDGRLVIMLYGLELPYIAAAGCRELLGREHETAVTGQAHDRTTRVGDLHPERGREAEPKVP